jgi:hypothetical protein
VSQQTAPARQQKFQALQQNLARQGLIFTTPPAAGKVRSYTGHSNIWPTGFPASLLQQPVLNEVYPARFADVSPYGFIFMAMRDMVQNPRQDNFLWCTTSNQIREEGNLFAPGLQNINIDPTNIIHLTTRRTAEVLWAMEEAARSGALKAVVGIVDNLSFTQSRRLSLAANKGSTSIFMLRPYNFSGAGTAFSRWKISSHPSQANIFNPRAPGAAALQVQLQTCRNGHKGKWICHDEPAQNNLSVVTSSGHRTPSAPQQQKSKHFIRLTG